MHANKPVRSTKTAADKAHAAFVAELEAEFGRYVTYPTASKITTASVRTLKRATDKGELPAFRIGSARVLRLRTADVAALIVPVN